MSYNYCEGTPGFKPVELCSMSDPVTKRYKAMGKLGSATNIWSLGASLVSMCNRDHEPKTDFFTPEMSIPDFNDNAQRFYSQELRDLLAKCVRYRGHDRIGPQDLLESISRLTAGTAAAPGAADLADGMREGHDTADAAPVWQSSIKERYRLAMTYAAGEKEREAEEKEDADKAKEEKERQKKKAADDKVAKAAAAKAEKEAAKGQKGNKGKK